MLLELETLLALKKHKTMTRAALALRVSQSAVSKRISALEDRLGKPLLQRQGRLVILTAEAHELIDEALPAYQQLQDVLSRKTISHVNRVLVVGVSDSVLSTWGAKVLQKASQGLDLQLQLHCHRSPVVQEKVESGQYDLGICAGPVGTKSGGLQVWDWTKEEMIFCGEGLPKSVSQLKEQKVLTIERSSSTWKAMDLELSQRGFHNYESMESFMAIAQVSKTTGQLGLIPVGVAKVLKIQNQQSLKPKLTRSIQIVMQKSRSQRTHHKEFVERLLQIKDFGF